jgi:membrane associated rhomboid family serine protease
MEIVLIPQHWSAILCICIMIGALIFAYAKKLMMTYALIIANIVIFVLTLIYTNEIIYGFGEFAGQYTGLGGLGFRSAYLSPEFSPQIYTVFTSMFIHGGFLHIFGNMFIFLFIGLAFEQRIGWKKFLIIYLVTGVCGTLTHSILNLESWIPLIGASGAIFGIMGAFAYSYPRDEVVMPIPIGIMFITRVKVMYAVILFAIMETAIVWWEGQTGLQSSTAHFAHLGGLISGFILAALILRRKSVRDSVSFQTIYKDSYIPSKITEKDFSNLKQFANTPELNDSLKKIENETVQQVRDIWLEHFFEKAVCPKCKNPVNHFDGKVWCDSCGFRTSY